MSVYDYASCIKIVFDIPIANDPEAITGTEEFTPTLAGGIAISSGDYVNQPASNVFDGQISTYWRSDTATMPKYIGRDFGRDVTLTKVGVYLASYKPNAYQMQGSANGTDWADVATGNFTSTTGWQYIMFDAATYRYWRLYVTSLQSSVLYIYELMFYGVRNTYSTVGWDVYATEYDKIAEGTEGIKHYTVRKVTKSEDGLSVYLWLDLGGRIWYPKDTVTVKFTGTMFSAEVGFVDPFEIS